MPSLHLFGTPRLATSGRADVMLSAREAGLLAWLHLEGPSPRAQIAGLLWPGGDESQARANLRQALVRLKRAAGEVLAESAGVLRLAEDLTVAPEGTPGKGDSETSPGTHRLLGPLEFDDAPEFAEWLQTRREAAVRERRRRQLALSRHALDAGALDEALASAEAVLAFDNAVEDAHRLRMEVFYLRGDRAAAITAWDDCRDALRTAYGITPSAATNELGRLVLAAEAADQRQAAPSRVQARQAAAAAVLPAALRRPPQLVGRDAVLDEIRRALALGHGVVVAGPGGIGKSRLLTQVAAAMEPAVIVGARPGDEHQPGMVAARLVTAAVERFGPDLDKATRADIALLRPGGPARGRALQSALEHRRVLASVARTMLACHAKGMRLVVVDDLQFADDLSMEAIGAVVGGWLAQPPESAALPLFGCRPGELRPPAAALVRMLDGSTRSARIDLAPWSTQDIKALLDSLPLELAGAAALDRRALAQALHARVGGNPAFVLESVKALWLSGLAQWHAEQPLVVPATLLESLRQRLAQLSGEALQLAQLAAVAGDDFTLPLAATALGRPALALAPLFAELEAAQLLDGIRFSHDLVAEAARTALPSALVAPLHQLVAEHLRSQRGAAARIAWHLQQAGDEVAAVPWHLAAGQAARDRWQLADAARSFESAALGMERQQHDGGPTWRAEQALPAAPAPASSSPTAAGTPDSIASTWLQAARWWTAVSDYPAALRALDRGLATAGTTAERLELQASRVVVLLNSQRVGEATEHAGSLAAALQTDGSALPADRLAAALFACTAVAPYSPQPHSLASLCDAVRARCEAGPPRARLSFHLAVGTCLNWLGQPVQASADLQRARDLADGFGDHGSIVNVTHQQLRAALLRGDAHGALAAAQDCGKAVLAGGYGLSFRLHAWAAQALAALAAGQPGEALTALQALEANAAAGADVDLRTEPEVAAARALAWCALGRPERAAQGLQGHEGWLAFAHWRLAATASAREAALAEMARRWPAADGVMGFRRRVLAMSLEAPKPADAEALLAELRARALWPLARQAHGIAARSALAAADVERAVAHAREALALAEHVDPWTDEGAAVWLDAAAVLRAAGAAAEAAAAREQGRAWVTRLAEALPAEADRLAWRDRHPLHKALMADG
ncbi:MAG: AAA family ATPase [Rubrivivax sp.]|nr:AAA family ATPase [Rubrivivax sp.]